MQHHDHGERDDRPFDATTHLYIRTNPADDGSEPLPPNLAFWASPDIAIERPGGILGGEAEPLVQNRVKVTVTNGGGQPAVDAYVEVFVVTPTTHITPATATLIGDEFVTVQAYSTADVWLPWTPLPSDSGHRCLVARVSLYAPLDAVRDPTIFDVVGDRHVAQRNIQVLEVQAGERRSFRFKLAHPRIGDGPRSLTVVETTFETDRQALVRMGGCEGGLPATMPLAELGVRALSDIGPSRGSPDDLLSGRGDGDWSTPGFPDWQPLRPSLLGLTNYGVVSFAVASDDEVGRLHAFDVIETDATGARLGGLSFVVRVV
ncbi:MAG: hypothetical protein QM708_00670 [Propioniciclava sp.]|uniref:hypothetical protein n=1 Tax=Propioniciclava sp. TaxID=2038686 RepID=UPI0039E25A72